MVELAEIFRLHGPQYRAQFGARMLPSHLRAMQDIETCRTASLGGQLYYCAHCDEQRYSYHSCKNRHCPKCQNEQANNWLKEQQSLLLPVTHFLLTFTLPEELRAVARSNQKTIYNLLFRASSQALLQLAHDPRFVGACLGLRAPHLDPPTALSSPRPLHRYGMNANTHLRVAVQILISEENMQEFYPKVRKGLRKVWSQGAVKRI
jgi:hypothetical protein